MNKNIKKEFLINGIFLLATILLVSLFSFSTSALYPENYQTNGNLFTASSMLIGKGWTKGYIPYKDLMGADGPAFYLIEAIGWLLGERTGLMIIQIITTTVIAGLFYKLSRLYIGMGWAFVASLISLLIMIAGGGVENCPQLYILCISLGVLYWYLSRREKISLWNSFGLGIVFAVAMLIKLQSAIWVYAVIACVFVSLFKIDKKQIWKYIGMSALGFLLILLPFIIYFGFNNALKEFIDAVFILNIRALGQGFGTANEIIRKVIKCIPAILVLGIEIYLYKKTKKRDKIWLVAAAFAMVLLLTGNGYWNYYILLIPFGVCPISVEMEEVIEKKKVYIALISLCMVAIFAIPLKNTLSYWRNNILSGEYELQNEAVKDWYKEEAGNQTVLCVDISAAYYLVTQQMPAFRLFADQTWIINTQSDYYDELMDYVYSNPVDWMLVDAGGLMSEWYGHYKYQYFFDLYDLTAAYKLNLEEESEDYNVYEELTDEDK